MAGWRGEPGIVERPEPFDPAVIATPLPVGAVPVADLAAVLSADGRSRWLLLTGSGRLLLFDAGSGACEEVATCTVPAEPGREPWAGKVLRRRVYVSPGCPLRCRRQRFRPVRAGHRPHHRQGDAGPGRRHLPARHGAALTGLRPPQPAAGADRPPQPAAGPERSGNCAAGWTPTRGSPRTARPCAACATATTTGPCRWPGSAATFSRSAASAPTTRPCCPAYGSSMSPAAWKCGRWRAREVLSRRRAATLLRGPAGPGDLASRHRAPHRTHPRFHADAPPPHRRRTGHPPRGTRQPAALAATPGRTPRRMRTARVAPDRTRRAFGPGSIVATPRPAV
jgi:hypothetical protein